MAIAVAAAFAPVLSAQALSFDDDQYLTNNPLVRAPGWASATRFLSEVLEPSTVRGYYEPLSMITLMLDAADGGRPGRLEPFHRTALLLHAANAALVTLLAHALFGSVAAAAAAGLLFGLHPLAVEPVAWIAQRKTLLAAFFSLLALLAHVRSARGARRWTWRGASLGAYALALLSKPTASPVPFLMLLLDAWPLGRFGRRAVVEKSPFFVAGALSAVVSFVSQRRTSVAVLPGEYPPEAIPLVAAHNVIFYLRKIAWPAEVSAHYPFPRPLAVAHPAVLAGVVGSLLLAAVVAVSWRRTRAVGIGVGFYLVALFPTLGVVGFTDAVAADRFVYLPSVGLALLLAWALARATGGGVARGRAALAAAALGAVAVVAAFEIAGARRHIEAWRDSERLYRHMLSVAPDAFPPRNNLAILLADAGRTEEALAEYRRALEIRPQAWAAHNNLGVLLVRMGRAAEALPHFEAALRVKPGWHTALTNLANALLELGRADEAVAHYEEALREKPDHAIAHNNLAEALVRLGRLPEAVRQYEEAVRLDPGLVDAWVSLGDARRETGDVEGARAAYEEALRVDPAHTTAREAIAGLATVR